MAFKKAERRKVKLKIAIQGPSGSGKTYSALKLAKALGKKIGMVDTEHGSGSLYADTLEMPEYDADEIAAPYHTDKYLRAIDLAVKGGYDVLIIDSISHQWTGEGGILDRMDKEKLAKPSANHFTMWAKYTPEHTRFRDGILSAPIHIIATMRSKTEYALTENEKGKQQPKKMGMKAEQREQFEYEFTTVFDVNMEHYYCVSKDRTGLFDGRNEQISEKTGEELLNWLASGKEAEAPPPPAAPKKTFDETLKEFGWSKEQAQEWCRLKFKLQDGQKTSPAQIDELLATMKVTPADQALFMLVDPPEMKKE